MTAGWDGTARIWDAASGEQLLKLDHSWNVKCAAFNRERTLIVTASGDNTTLLWDARSGSRVGSLDGPPHSGGRATLDPFAECAAFSPDGSYVATAFDTGMVWIWDVGSRQPLAYWLAHALRATSVAFSPDGERVVTASNDGTAHIWELRKLLGS